MTRLGLPPEHVHFEAAGFDPAQPGHVLRLPLRDGRVLVCHMSEDVRAQLGIEPTPPAVLRDEPVKVRVQRRRAA